ncbi:sterol desaturase family protein [Kistimonas scapharcae]|uniref:Sterol desaturase family protein n=1 Tax=Kistimonas scapharcae TaxID=1036133 RepID=A0ABP8V0U0_9GAMM
MDYILYAIPVFLLLIAIEILATVIRKKDYYRTNDAINSISTGMISTAANLTTKVVTFTIYVAVFEYLAPFQLDASHLWVWVLGFFLKDFFYYWYHRAGHEINILWASHAVHHQSEEYNMTTALRQTSTGFLFNWIFYVPVALVGIPPVVFFAVSSINLLYQYWVHTRHIPKLGWFEWFFITPSNHRVHHAKNRRYLDKNYGGVFIIWDRLFGTYAEEDNNYEPIRYGTLKPLRSWNPLWANLQLYVHLGQDAVKTRSWKDKLTLWFRRTGYRPADVATPMKMPDIHAYENYNPFVNPTLQAYVAFQFLILIVGTVLLIAANDTLSFGLTVLWTAMLGYQLLIIGWLQEKKNGFVWLELSRFVAVIPALILTQKELSLTHDMMLSLAVYGVLSLAAISIIGSKKTIVSYQNS